MFDYVLLSLLIFLRRILLYLCNIQLMYAVNMLLDSCSVIRS